MKDIEQITFPKLDWTDGEALKSAEKLYSYVVDHAEKSQKWYLERKNGKKIPGFYLRIGAMICTAVAGIIPMLTNVIVKAGGAPEINPVLSGVAIAVAAFFIALDKLGDLTSGWVRYMLTAQEIRNHIEKFRFQWESKKLQWNDGSFEQEQIEESITTCMEFVDTVNTIVLDESKEWASEFLSNMKEIEKAAKVKSAAVRLGGINITVVDGEKFDEGWTIRVGAGKKKPYNGTTASIPRRYPGIYLIAVEGKIGGENKFVEKSVEVIAGKIVNISLDPN